MKIIDSILTDAGSIAAIRKDIHAHPELCFQEVRTADVVAKQLTDWGIPILRGMGTTGVVGVVHGRDGGACGRGRRQPGGTAGPAPKRRRCSDWGQGISRTDMQYIYFII